MLLRSFSLSLLLISVLICPTLLRAQSVHEGYADLSSLNISEGYPANLSGTWEFYPGQLLEPDELQQSKDRVWINVPGTWHRQGDYPLLGVATYRVQLKLNEAHSGLVLYFPVINCASRVYLNGILIKETGKVSADRKQYEPKLSSTFIPVPDHIPEAEIVIQVANYTYFSAGISGTPKLDRSFHLFSMINQRHGIENFFAGSLMAMFVYQIILYLLFRGGKPYLWLSLICLVVALRAMIVHGGSFLLPDLFPSVSWELWKKLEFGGVYAIGAFFPLYMFQLFREIAPRKPLVFFIGISGLLCLSVIFFPQYRYGQLLDVAHLLLLLGFIYAVYVTVKAWRFEMRDAKIIFYAVLASFPFILAEIVKNSLWFPLPINFMYLVELGVLIYLLFQVYLLASHYAMSFKSMEQLNLNLEKIVEERSGQLIRANQVKEKLLSVMSHDIKSPLNSLQGILQIFNKGALTGEELSTYTNQIEGELAKTRLLVDNVLDWTAGQLKGIEVEEESFDLQKLVESNIQLSKVPANHKKVAIHFDRIEPYIVHTDKNILSMVLRNLLANAIKFSHKNGNIYLSIEGLQKCHVIRVRDEGVGMEPNKLASLTNPKLVVSQLGTVNEKGTGIGIALCRDYLEKVGGKLEIESAPGKGSTFTIMVPK